MSIRLQSMDQCIFTLGESPAPDLEDMLGGIALLAYGDTARAMGLRSVVGDTRIRCLAVHEDAAETPHGSELNQVKGHHKCEVASVSETISILTGAAESFDPSKALPIFIDVSCLARPLIGALFATLAKIAERRPVKLYVGYQLAKFSEPPAVWAHPIRRIEPIHPNFSGWTGSALMPLSVVVGLGYERGKAQGALEYLEPSKRYVMIPESPESDYLQEVKKQNERLLGEAGCLRARYQVMDPVGTFGTLLSMTSGFKNRSRGLLLPFGPKIFLAVSLLIGMTDDEIAVWHVDGENNEPNLKSEPSKRSLIFWCELGPKYSTTATNRPA
ncbi:MAG: hypothetical protein ACRETM_13920 [Stenotrophobium sp.]